MVVQTGAVAKPNPRQQELDDQAQLRLREKMIARKHRKLYRSMMDGRRKRAREANLLEKKRQQIDAEGRSQRKLSKKSAPLSAAKWGNPLTSVQQSKYFTSETLNVEFLSISVHWRQLAQRNI